MADEFERRPQRAIGRRRHRDPMVRAAARGVRLNRQEQRLVGIEDRRRALHMFNLGWSDQDIARVLFTTPDAVRGWIDQALAEYVLTPAAAAEAKKRQLASLGELKRRIAQVLDAVDQDTPNPNTLKAVKEFVAVLKREAELLGLDAPRRVDVTQADAGTDANLAAIIQRANERLAAQQAALEQPDA